MKKYILIILFISLCKISVAQTDTLSRLELYNLGLKDAEVNFKASKKANIITLITTSVSPLFGLIPAIKFDRKELTNEQLNYPSIELSKNLDYHLGYKEKPQKLRKRKFGTDT